MHSVFTHSPAPRRRELDYLSGSRTPLLRFDLNLNSLLRFDLNLNLNPLLRFDLNLNLNPLLRFDLNLNLNPLLRFDLNLNQLLKFALDLNLVIRSYVGYGTKSSNKSKFDTGC